MNHMDEPQKEISSLPIHNLVGLVMALFFIPALALSGWAKYVNSGWSVLVVGLFMGVGGAALLLY
jgi:hypothetical protein